MPYRIALALISLALVASCNVTNPTVDPADGPADPDVTAETRALYLNLKQVAEDHILFGHQDDLAYGVHWKAEPGRSDVMEVTGAYPAVYGWEVGDIGNPGAEENLDAVNFDRMRDWIIEGYERGGVMTVSWHMDNPVSGGGSWDTTRAVEHILPGGSYHDDFVDRLDRFAAFVQSIVTDDGVAVPIIFRPYHEMSGGWFWWGAGHTSPEDYRALWQFTADYLRDEKDLHNLLYAYSTGGLGDFEDPEDYWTWYPGDDYVDLVGFDDYGTLQHEGGVEAMAAHLSWLVEQAEARDKIPALTETGHEALADTSWYTDKLLASFHAEPGASRIAYVLVWRNANAETDRENHYYAPYPGHPAADDFIQFYESDLILFEDELPPMYVLP